MIKEEKMMPRYTVYIKYRSKKRGQGCGFYTDDLERAKRVAHNNRNSWHGQNGVYDWIKVKDVQIGKYIYEV